MRKPSGIVLELDKYFHGEEKNWEVDYLAKLRFEELNTGEEEARSIKSGLIELSVENKFLGKSKLANFFKRN